MQFWSGYFSLREANPMLHWKEKKNHFAPGVACIYTATDTDCEAQGPEDKERNDWGKELFIKPKDGEEKRRERITLHLFPLVRCHQGKKRAEPSEDGVSITPTEKERKEWAIEEDETRGTRGEGCIAAPRKPREEKNTHLRRELACRSLSTQCNWILFLMLQLHQSKFKQRGNQLYYGNQSPFQRLKPCDSCAFIPSTM